MSSSGVIFWPFVIIINAMAISGRTSSIVYVYSVYVYIDTHPQIHMHWPSHGDGPKSEILIFYLLSVLQCDPLTNKPMNYELLHISTKRIKHIEYQQ